MAKSDITNTADFKTNAVFVFRINGYSIYWKPSYSRWDAYRFVLVANGRQESTPSSNLLGAVAEACQMPNPKTGNSIKKLSTLQKRNLQKALSEHDSESKLKDLKKYGIDL